jgi:hypothetical protein
LIKGLAGKGFLVDGAVGVAVEEATQFVFEFVDAFYGGGHQRPGQVLIGQPLAAVDGVHEMALD